MTDQTSIEKAREPITQLLDVLEILRVVCVDDIYTDEPSIDDVLAALPQVDDIFILERFPELDSKILKEADILNASFRKIWEKLTIEERKQRGAIILSLARVKDGKSTNDSFNAGILHQLIPSKLLETLSPSQWKSQKESIISRSKKERTLLLIDQDLSRGGGSTTEGMVIILSILSRENCKNVICGLLTHTVTTENQHKKWEELAKTHGLDKDRFTVVSKSWLNKDPLGFARQLKLVALSPKFKSIINKFIDLILDSIGQAEKDIKSISIYDFDHIICQAATVEGAWEPDMLFRLFSLFYRSAAKKNTYKDKYLRELAGTLRSISQISTESPNTPPHSTWKIQRQENYEFGKYINGLHLPLEAGDIFQKTNVENGKYYILLAQPCDLAVRSDGKRHPNVNEGLLAEVTRSDGNRAFVEELPYFDVDHNIKYFVHLRKIHNVDLSILDLCVYNDEGFVKFTVGADYPKGIIPSWEKRYDVINEFHTKIFKSLELFANRKGENSEIRKIKETARSELKSKGKPFIANVNYSGSKKIVEYNCQRVARLCHPRALALVMKYSQCLTRPAHERDLGK